MNAAIFIGGFFVFCLLFLLQNPLKSEKEIIVLTRKKRLVAFENGLAQFQCDCAEEDPSRPAKAGLFRFHLDERLYRGSSAGGRCSEKIFLTVDGKRIEGAFCFSTTDRSSDAITLPCDYDQKMPQGCVRISEEDARILLEWVDVNTRVRFVQW